MLLQIRFILIDSRERKKKKRSRHVCNFLRACALWLICDPYPTEARTVVPNVVVPVMPPTAMGLAVETGSVRTGVEVMTPIILLVATES